MPPGVSVIVCTYNGSRRLPETLDYLSKQRVPAGRQCEVLLVNNASTDDTQYFAEHALVRYEWGSIDYRAVFEATPGLASARARGMREARHELIVFCDDDNHLEGDYLEKALRIFDHDPGLGIAGGWVKPSLEFYPGKWIEDFYGSLAIGKQGNASGPVNWVFGAGMVLRRQIFIDLENKKIKCMLSDRVGGNTSSGGDVELCLLASFVGYKVVYSPQLVLHHKIEAWRTTRRTFLSSASTNFRPTVYLHLLHNAVHDEGRARFGAMIGELVIKRIVEVGKAIARCILLRRLFLNFIVIYSNAIFLPRLLLNYWDLRLLNNQILDNLGHGGKGK